MAIKCIYEIEPERMGIPNYEKEKLYVSVGTKLSSMPGLKILSRFEEESDDADKTFIGFIVEVDSDEDYRRLNDELRTDDYRTGLFII